MDKRLITLEQAAEIGHVSIGTITRFLEAGCLTALRTRDGVTYVSGVQVASLFGKELSVLERFDLGLTEERLTVKTGGLEGGVDNGEGFPVGGSSLSEGGEEFDLEDIGGDREVNFGDGGVEVRPFDEKVGLGETILNGTEVLTEAQRVDELLKVIGFQDTLISDREERISELREHCVWLQKRVEKLESMSEQGSLVLLAEAYAIRRLLQAPPVEQRKGIIRSVLEAVGFLAPASVSISQASLSKVPLPSVGAPNTDIEIQQVDTGVSDVNGSSYRTQPRTTSSKSAIA